RPRLHDRRGHDERRQTGAGDQGAALGRDHSRQEGQRLRHRERRRAQEDVPILGRGRRRRLPRYVARPGLARRLRGPRALERQRPRRSQRSEMTQLSLRNPIAILMLCIAAVVFAGVATPRMAVDTFPDLTPPVLVVGTLAPGLGAKDVEKTLTWRIEKYVSATPGVDHVQSTSRNNLSIVWVWMKWGTDLNAAQTLVQQQTAFAMAAVPKSLGVLPPFVLQYDPSNA